jgi:hypothetical protein
MFKKLSIIISTILISSVITTMANGGIVVKIDGQEIAFPDVQPYVDSENRTMVPVRFLSEKLGATVGWDAQERKVYIKKGDDEVVLGIEQHRANISGKIRTVDAVIKEGRTMVPLSFVNDALKAGVDWNESTKVISIDTTQFKIYKYTIPTKMELTLQPDPNPIVLFKAVIDFTGKKDINKQFDELESILSSKLGKQRANEIITYMKQKKDIMTGFKSTDHFLMDDNYFFWVTGEKESSEADLRVMWLHD